MENRDCDPSTAALEVGLGGGRGGPCDVVME